MSNSSTVGQEIKRREAAAQPHPLVRSVPSDYAKSVIGRVRVSDAERIKAMAAETRELLACNRNSGRQIEAAARAIKEKALLEAVIVLVKPSLPPEAR